MEKDGNPLARFSEIELEQELNRRAFAKRMDKLTKSSHGGTKHRVSFDIYDRENGTTDMQCSISPDYLRVKRGRQGLIGAEHLAWVAINAVQEAIARRTLNLYVPKPSIVPLHSIKPHPRRPK